MANSSVKNLNIDGNVIISGSTTSIDVQQLTTDDNNITLNDIAAPLDANANAGGLTLKGTTDHTWNWLDATDSWTASENIDLATGKEYKINTTSVLNATTLGAGIVNSSLTDVGTLTSLQIDLLYLDGSQIGLKTTDEDLITLTNNTVTVAGTVAATQLTGGGTGITGLSTSNITVPASPGDFLYNNAGAWGGITPPISVALGGTGAANAATARTNLGVTATGTDTTYAYRANNLSDLASASTARTNLGLGTMAVETATDYLTVANDLSDVASVSLSRTNLGLGTTNSPNFGGVGTGFITITATPTSSPAAAPTFAGVVFKSIPVASGSGFKWVVGNEQDGDLAFTHVALNDAGANVGSSVGYITLSPSGTNVDIGNTGGTPVNVTISGLDYPTADGTANQVLTTDGAATLIFATPLTTNITEGTNLYYTAARDTAQFNTDLATKTTANLAEGANLYYTTARWDTKMAAADTADLSEGTNLYYTNARADARIALQVGANLDLSSKSTTNLSEGTNLYYTNIRADARIALANLNDLVDVHTAAPADGDVIAWDNGNSRWAPSIHKAVILANDVNDTHIDWGTGSNQVSTADIPESTNLFYTAARDTAQFNTDLATKTTANLAEGTNLYYTNARADARIAVANLSDLVDVHTASPTDGQSLSWDNSNSRWAPGNAGHASTSTLTEGTNLYFTDARADARIVNAGSANWNTAYTDTNAATDAATNSTIVKRGGTGNIAVSKLTANNGVILGTMPSAATGGIQWTGTDFHGYNGSAWVSLTSAATALISGAVATFTTTPTVTSTSYVDIAGYTTSITVTNSNIINVQANVDLSGSGTTVYNIKLVKVVSGTSTDLYIDEGGGATIPNIHLNATYADVHGQSNGTVITYKLMAKVDAGTLTVNPDGTNAQIFVQEMTTTPITVASVNGASGTVVLTTSNIAEGTNLYYTTARWDIKMAAADTDDLSEGSTNLYHQDDLGSVA
jgi:hypothetical protein